MPSWRKIITSGSDAALNSLSVTTNIEATSITGSLFGTASSASYISSSNIDGIIENAQTASYANLSTLHITPTVSTLVGGIEGDIAVSESKLWFNDGSGFREIQLI